MAVVNLERLADGSAVLAAPRRAIKLPAGWTVVDHPLDVLVGASGAGEVTGYLELVPPTVTPGAGGVSLGQPRPFIWPIATAQSVDATAHTLFTIPVPAGGWVRFMVRVGATLGAGANAGGWPHVFEALLLAARKGTGAPGVGDGDYSANGKPFIENQATPTAGATNVTVSGNNLLIQASGFAPPSAWQTSTAYVTGDGLTTPGSFVTANGNVYVCTTSGTSSGSAPSGTGTGLGTGAKWDFVAVGSVVPITWTGTIWAFTQG